MTQQTEPQNPSEIITPPPRPHKNANKTPIIVTGAAIVAFLVGVVYGRSMEESGTASARAGEKAAEEQLETARQQLADRNQQVEELYALIRDRNETIEKKEQKIDGLAQAVRDRTHKPMQICKALDDAQDNARTTLQKPIHVRIGENTILSVNVGKEQQQAVMNAFGQVQDHCML